jgi:hypothetical protein
MKALYKGIYQGCPIELAPTGYLLWCLENDFMDNLGIDIYKELKMRKLAIDESFSIMPQPMSQQAWLTYDWFAEWTDEVRQKYMSMVENDSKFLNPEHSRFATYYNNILAKLSVYAITNNIVDFAEKTQPEVVTEYQQHYNNFYEQLFERK